MNNKPASPPKTHSSLRCHLVALSSLLLLLPACTSTRPGSAVPQPSTTRPTTTPTTQKSTRPREIKIDGKKPCELLTTEQLATIAPTTPPRPSTSAFLDAPNCTFNANGAFWNVTIITTEGIEQWTNGKRRGRPAEIPPIAGYPAITITLPTDPVACDIAIDVADGQYLFTGFEARKNFTNKFPTPCDGARIVGELAMQNLQP
jgi:hypothetical protein